MIAWLKKYWKGLVAAVGGLALAIFGATAWYERRKLRAAAQKLLAANSDPLKIAAQIEGARELKDSMDELNRKERPYDTQSLVDYIAGKRRESGK